MKLTDIYREYTELVGGYIQRGYIFHKDGYSLKSDCETHQELIHPINGKVQISIKRQYLSRPDSSLGIVLGTCLVLMVESGKHEVYRKIFIPSSRNDLSSSWFFTEEDAVDRRITRFERMKSRQLEEKNYNTPGRREIALKYIKRTQRGCSRKKIDDIVSIDKEYDHISESYYYSICFRRGNNLDYALISC